MPFKLHRSPGIYFAGSLACCTHVFCRASTAWPPATALFRLAGGMNLADLRIRRSESHESSLSQVFTCTENKKGFISRRGCYASSCNMNLRSSLSDTAAFVAGLLCDLPSLSQSWSPCKPWRAGRERVGHLKHAETLAARSCGAHPGHHQAVQTTPCAACPVHQPVLFQGVPYSLECVEELVAHKVLLAIHAGEASSHVVGAAHGGRHVVQHPVVGRDAALAGVGQRVGANRELRGGGRKAGRGALAPAAAGLGCGGMPVRAGWRWRRHLHVHV